MSVTPEAEATLSADSTATLKARVVELERELRMAIGVIDALPQGVFWKDADLRLRGCNKVGRQVVGITNDMQFIGLTDFEMPYSREQAEAFVADDREVMARREARPPVITSAQGFQGETRWVEHTKAPIFGDSDELLGVVGIFRDITDQKLAEQATAAEQRAAMLRMSTPLLPVADGVIVLPLIGSLDPDRAEQVMQALLAGVVEHRATTAIL
ncbi:MAG TPA: PAS domain-containing protein, partial [Nannocystis sp.]